MMRAQMPDLADSAPTAVPRPRSCSFQSTPATTAAGLKARNLTPAEERAMRAQVNRYLIEEWRQSQLEVADSVHHSVLLRIGTTFDSATSAGVSANAQRDLMTRLDRLIRANEYSWVFFRTQVNG